MSIKLICSDIDGTLLQYGKKELEDEIFELIRELHRRGILLKYSHRRMESNTLSMSSCASPM